MFAVNKRYKNMSFRDTTNLLNLKKGDTIKVVELWKNARTHLTLGKEYKAIKVVKNDNRCYKNKFTIISDQNKKRDYKLNNTMFEIVSTKPYTKEELKLMKDFYRQSAHDTQMWNALKEDPDRDKYNDDSRDTHSHDYRKNIKLHLRNYFSYIFYSIQCINNIEPFN